MTSEPTDGRLGEDFYRRYWQREPLLVRGGVDPAALQTVDQDWLLEASADPQLHSRLVCGPDNSGRYAVSYGPDLIVPKTDQPWTLLVRDIDKILPQADALLDRFAGAGRWRLEDIMVSFAVAGGSVGPHLDHYDVFLVQASGRRRWQVDTRPHPDTRQQPDQELQLLSHFTPGQEWILEPGDWLYLPPGVPHHGVALEPCITWSVGLRTPATAELWAEFAEWQIDRSDEHMRLADPYRRPDRCGEILAQDLSQVRQMLGGVGHVSDTELAGWLGCFVTRSGAEWTDSLNNQRQARELPAHGPLRRSPGALLAWYADSKQSWLFANGQQFAVDRRDAAVLAAQRTVSETARQRLTQRGQQGVLRELFKQGVFQAL